MLGDLIFLDGFSKNTQISNLMKIRPVGAELFHGDGQTGVTEANSRFSLFGEAPKDSQMYKVSECTLGKQ